MQPQEYIEYFEDSADASLRAKSEPDAVIGQKRGFFKGLILRGADSVEEQDKQSGGIC